MAGCMSITVEIEPGIRPMTSIKYEGETVEQATESLIASGWQGGRGWSADANEQFILRMAAFAWWRHNGYHPQVVPNYAWTSPCPGAWTQGAWICTGGGTAHRARPQLPRVRLRPVAAEIVQTNTRLVCDCPKPRRGRNSRLLLVE